jgi:gliding motility-associated-like protein
MRSVFPFHNSLPIHSPYRKAAYFLIITMLNTKALFLTFLSLLMSLCLWAQTPNADFTSNITSGCSPIIVNFEDKSSGNITSWKWDFGNGATSTRQHPSTTYITAGTFTVTLITSNELESDTITKTAYITTYDGPTVNFSTDKTASCAPGTIQFTDNSVASAGTTNTTWQWDFGDGTSSTEQNPVHTYTSPGIYTVLLKVTNDKGCFKVLARSNLITIFEGVTAGFSNTSPDLCRPPATVGFTNESSGPGTLTSTWSFGDGGTAQSQNASHTYTQEGTFPVALIVSSSLGCADTITKDNAVIIGGIKSDFTITDSLCAASNVTFNNTSLPAPASFQWIFPDGTTSTQANPVKKFDAVGSYTIRLINQFANCLDTLVKTINVSGKPVVNFSAADTINCSAPFTVNFQNGTNEAVSYQWFFGDGNSSTDPNPSHTYSGFGNYNVTLKATNAAGCIDSLTKPSLIKIRKPVISFQGLPARGCIPYTIKPVAVVNTLDSVLTYEWNFGDGGTASGKSPSYTYTTQGTYPVTVTITTSKGCTETFTLNNAVRVGTKPQADFTADTTVVCASDKIQFINQSSVPTDEYLWLFGDGKSSRAKNPLYQFTDTGLLDVTLIAYNNGCGDSLIKTDYVRIKPPIAKFTFQPDCNNRLNYTFTDSSIGATSYVWNFGDGSPDVTTKNPGVHSFPRLGTYNVTLTVTNAECSYSQTSTIRIVDQTPNFTASAQVGCKNFRPTFTASSPVRVAAYSWDFGNGGTSSAQRPARTYNAAGEFDVKLVTTDIYGCKDSITKENYIQVYGPTASFRTATTSGCVGLNVTFADSSKSDGTNPIVRWQWDFGDGTGQSLEQTPAYTYNTIDTFNVKLIIEDAGGCKDSLTRNNYIRVSDLKAAWDAIQESCPQTPVAFNNRTQGNFTSTWLFGDGATSTARSPRHAYTDTGRYAISLIVRDPNGCIDTLTRENHLYIGKPVASFTANNLTTYCTPFEARLTNTSQYYRSFIWSFQSGTSRTPNPTTYYTKTGTDNIKLVVTSPGGCKDSITKTMQVKSLADGKITYTPLTGCTPTTVTMETSDSINAKYTWDFGDGNIVDTVANKISHVYKDFGKFVPKVIIEEQCIVALSGKETINLLGVHAKFDASKTLVCDTGIVVFTDSTTFNDPVRSYRWDFGDGGTSTQQSPSHFYDRPGDYTVRLDVETQQGCKDSAFFSIMKVSLNPRIAITGDTSICLGERVQYAGHFTRTDTSAVTWQWQFPNNHGSTAQNPDLQLFQLAGSYQVKAYAINSSGCMDSAFLPLHVHPIPTIEVPPSITLGNGNSVTIPASYSPGVTKYNWTPEKGLSCTDCPQPVASPQFNTQYTVTVSDANGCRDVANVLVTVLCKNSEVFIPNTFSPNGDGSNDIFYVRGKGIERVKSFRIFNRWGELVFEKSEIPPNIESPMYGWDGKHKGANPHPDVYIYQVEVYCNNGELFRFQGNVALVQ